MSRLGSKAASTAPQCPFCFALINGHNRPTRLVRFSDIGRWKVWSTARERPPWFTLPIYYRFYKGLSLTDRIPSRGANAHRNRFALSYSPFPTVRKVHFDDREMN